MNTAFYSGLSGLTAYSSALNIVGNNLSNMNTAGFKTSDVNFHDLVTRTFGGVATDGAGNPMQIGLGTLTNSITGIFSQGAIQTTGDSTNVALEGNGFFVVGDGVDERYYTRAGNFFFNEDGYLVNPSGQFVLGYTEMDANNELIPSGPLNSIFLPSNTIADPQASTLVDFFMNLDVRDAINSEYSASTTVFDSKGAPHTLTATFTHNGLNGDGNDEWAYQLYLPGADVQGGVAGTDFALLAAPGTIEFDANGTLIERDNAPVADLNIVTPAFTNGADPLDFDWRLVDDNGTPIITGYPIPSTTTATNTDGFPPGNLTSIIIDADGVLQGVFSNGQVEEMAQLAISQFNNNKGLIRMGHNLYAETNASGTPSIGAANTGGRGTVVGSSLEASNVDIAEQFTKMLVFERGYQANSKIITASDTLTQTAISLVR